MVPQRAPPCLPPPTELETVLPERWADFQAVILNQEDTEERWSLDPLVTVKWVVLVVVGR